MKSLAFPDMFTSTSTKVIEDREATKSNLQLLFYSQKNELFGDPAFGSPLIQALFEQNNQILIDIAIDYVYSTILTFMPQLYLERKNITITQKRANLYVEFSALNQLDYTTDLYEIALTANDEYSSGSGS